MAFEIVAVNSANDAAHLLMSEYLSSSVTNSLKISYQTEVDLFQLNSPRIGEIRG